MTIETDFKRVPLFRLPSLAAADARTADGGSYSIDGNLHVASMLQFGPFRLLHTLGEGEFGKVKLAVFHPTTIQPMAPHDPETSVSCTNDSEDDEYRLFEQGSVVAIKFIKKSLLSSRSKLAKLHREIHILRRHLPTHPHLINLSLVLESEKYIGLVMEYASGGELFDYILNKKYLGEQEARWLFSQLMAGVRHMHQNCIVHRDLKLENLLLVHDPTPYQYYLQHCRNTADSAAQPPWTRKYDRILKITDMGFANKFKDSKQSLVETSCGSPCYAAPELVINTPPTSANKENARHSSANTAEDKDWDGTKYEYDGIKADLWSCGVILYSMLCGYLPFDDDPRNPESSNVGLLYEYILKQRKPKFADYVRRDHAAREIVLGLMNVSPDERWSMDQCLNHEWMRMYKEYIERAHCVPPPEIEQKLIARSISSDEVAERVEILDQTTPLKKPDTIRDRTVSAPIPNDPNGHPNSKASAAAKSKFRKAFLRVDTSVSGLVKWFGGGMNISSDSMGPSSGHSQVQNAISPGLLSANSPMKTTHKGENGLHPPPQPQSASTSIAVSERSADEELTIQSADTNKKSNRWWNKLRLPKLGGPESESSNGSSRSGIQTRPRSNTEPVLHVGYGGGSTGTGRK